MRPKHACFFADELLQYMVDRPGHPDFLHRVANADDDLTDLRIRTTRSFQTDVVAIASQRTGQVVVVAVNYVHN